MNDVIRSALRRQTCASDCILGAASTVGITIKLKTEEPNLSSSRISTIRQMLLLRTKSKTVNLRAQPRIQEPIKHESVKQETWLRSSRILPSQEMPYDHKPDVSCGARACPGIPEMSCDRVTCPAIDGRAPALLCAVVTRPRCCSDVSIVTFMDVQRCAATRDESDRESAKHNTSFGRGTHAECCINLRVGHTTETQCQPLLLPASNTLPLKNMAAAFKHTRPQQGLYDYLDKCSNRNSSYALLLMHATCSLDV